MNFTEAIDILRKGNGVGPTEDEAIETIRSEINCAKNLELTLVTLVCELQHSRNPSFSYQILRAIGESGNHQIEESFVLRQMFISEPLGSESVFDGVWRCRSALLACTSVFGTDSPRPAQ